MQKTPCVNVIVGIPLLFVLRFTSDTSEPGDLLDQCRLDISNF